MPGPALGPARAVAQSAFDAACTITRDPEGAHDDRRNYTTGTVTPGPGDTSTVYTGPCMVRPAADRRGSQVEAGATMWEQLYRVRIPTTAPAVQRGDVVTVTASPNDQIVVGRRLLVTRVDGGTYAVTRVLTCTVKERGPEL